MIFMKQEGSHLFYTLHFHFHSTFETPTEPAEWCTHLSLQQLLHLGDPRELPCQLEPPPACPPSMSRPCPRLSSQSAVANIHSKGMHMREWHPYQVPDNLSWLLWMQRSGSLTKPCGLPGFSLCHRYSTELRQCVHKPLFWLLLGVHKCIPVVTTQVLLTIDEGQNKNILVNKDSCIVAILCFHSPQLRAGISAAFSSSEQLHSLGLWLKESWWHTVWNLVAQRSTAQRKSVKQREDIICEEKCHHNVTELDTLRL